MSPILWLVSLGSPGVAYAEVDYDCAHTGSSDTDEKSDSGCKGCATQGSTAAVGVTTLLGLFAALRRRR